MASLKPYDLSQSPQKVKHEPTPYNLNYAHREKRQKKYKDSLHGFTAIALSKAGAWQLIRAKCHELGLVVPTHDKINLCLG